MNRQMNNINTGAPADRSGAGRKIANTSKGRRPRIYICCPIRPKAKDPEEAVKELKANLDRAERACALIIAAGGIPLCSPLYCIYGLNLDDLNPEDILSLPAATRAWQSVLAIFSS